MPLSNRLIWPTLGCVLVNAQLACGLAAALLVTVQWWLPHTRHSGEASRRTCCPHFRLAVTLVMCQCDLNWSPWSQLVCLQRILLCGSYKMDFTIHSTDFLTTYPSPPLSHGRLWSSCICSYIYHFSKLPKAFCRSAALIGGPLFLTLCSCLRVILSLTLPLAAFIQTFTEHLLCARTCW